MRKQLIEQGMALEDTDYDSDISERDVKHYAEEDSSDDKEENIPREGMPLSLFDIVALARLNVRRCNVIDGVTFQTVPRFQV